MSLIVFSCKTLVVLKWTKVSMTHLSSVDLPLLKVLHLNLVDFFEGIDLAQLLFGCPNLEDLEAMSLYMDQKDLISEFHNLTHKLNWTVCNILWTGLKC
ncbi:F-box/FBD/LRR-repeat protein [Spatholobus suberectus]|nr:F-box/FBD/LRR-repeat protein [Spatholobus suberectus]